MTTGRFGSCSRKTSETEVEVSISLDGQGLFEGSTGLKFLDHMLAQLAFHSLSDMRVSVKWDLVHHGVEDTAITLGKAIGEALGEREGINRFGHALVPMDESIASVAVDLVRRAYVRVDLKLTGTRVEDVAAEDLVHFIESVVINVPAVAHVEVLRGYNDHHKVEAAFKALALALRHAWSTNPRYAYGRSTKGSV
ncbi:MAG: imidazoleglycerol-phosphate dehydratase [Thaumarchaeota archaeon]|nr:imidazoleglycerol-phosphate dehydratase [Candidatus Calditenuaceae archaeon]MDW8186512.1 imidazoleglycerol-phosphate dehydratase [Nitrososphaerota archaeon]